MRWPWQKKPVAPEGVALKFQSGEVVPCELFYVGKIEGVHTWEITMQIEDVREIHSLVVPGGMPPGTAIRAKGRL